MIFCNNAPCFSKKKSCSDTSFTFCGISIGIGQKVLLSPTPFLPCYQVVLERFATASCWPPLTNLKCPWVGWWKFCLKNFKASPVVAVTKLPMRSEVDKFEARSKGRARRRKTLSTFLNVHSILYQWRGGLQSCGPPSGYQSGCVGVPLIRTQGSLLNRYSLLILLYREEPHVEYFLICLRRVSAIVTTLIHWSSRHPAPPCTLTIALV